MSAVVDKGIPVPEGPMGALAKWPWKQMEVGDSFLAKGKTMRQFQSSVSRAGQVYKRKFICRAVEGGIRVWRIG